MTNPVCAIRLATRVDAPAIAALHARLLPEGFLPALGEPFLERLYRRVALSDRSFAFVGTAGTGPVAGFVAVAECTGDLYREFVLRDGLLAGLQALPAIIRHPRKVAETLRHGMTSDVDRPGAEILAVAVAVSARGAGTGVSLVEAATAELLRRGVDEAHVVTAVGNDAARRMYLRCGFEPRTTIEVHRGAPQEVLVWGR
jgi:ribosomal protein S18 acetylase RimI-like enzyme